MKTFVPLRDCKKGKEKPPPGNADLAGKTKGNVL